MRENPNPNIQTGSWSRGRIIITLFTSFLLFLIFKNILTKDYKNETKNYLTKIGREDAIERVIPKTTTVRYLFIISLLYLYYFNFILFFK